MHAIHASFPFVLGKRLEPGQAAAQSAFVFTKAKQGKPMLSSNGLDGDNSKLQLTPKAFAWLNSDFFWVVLSSVAEFRESSRQRDRANCKDHITPVNVPN